MTGEGAADSVPSFADMLRLRPDSGAPDGVSRTTATLDQSWWTWSGPHGGLLAALALTAARGVVADDRAPQCLNIHFLAPAREKELTLKSRSRPGTTEFDALRLAAAEDEVVDNDSRTVATACGLPARNDLKRGSLRMSGGVPDHSQRKAEPCLYSMRTSPLTDSHLYRSRH